MWRCDAQRVQAAACISEDGAGGQIPTMIIKDRGLLQKTDEELSASVDSGWRDAIPSDLDDIRFSQF